MEKTLLSVVLAVAAIALAGCQPAKRTAEEPLPSGEPVVMKLGEDVVSDEPRSALATFGSGCFWCTEAFFQEVEGVAKVESGYSGGKVENPTYYEVCSGRTGHAEVVQVTFDPSKVSFEELLEIFWQTHDPTTLNRQGADMGTQYRSVVFYHDDKQKKVAEQYKEKLDKAGIWRNPIVTEISPFTKFYVAEVDHQDYFRLNPNAGYCQAVIVPKMEKFRKVFKEKLKAGND